MMNATKSSLRSFDNVCLMRSIYRWQGRVEETEEVAALFKTMAEGAEGLIERLAGLHSYDVPAAVVWPIERALPAYAQWIESETKC